MEKIGVKIELSVSLTVENIDDIMASALEGGINYWAYKAKVVGEYLGEYASEQISRGGSLKIYLIEPFDEEDTEVYELDREKLVNGFKLWLENGQDFYGAVDSRGNVDCGQIDADCADSIMQYALFGDLVFA